MNKGKRIFAVAVALLLAAVLISSAAFIAANADHDCCGEQCAVCAGIVTCVRTFGLAAKSLAVMAFIAVVICRAAREIIFFTGREKADTPVTFKVKLLN